MKESKFALFFCEPGLPQPKSKSPKSLQSKKWSNHKHSSELGPQNGQLLSFQLHLKFGLAIQLRLNNALGVKFSLIACPQAAMFVIPPVLCIPSLPGRGGELYPSTYRANRRFEDQFIKIYKSTYSRPILSVLYISLSFLDCKHFQTF